jgi:hypothetical protein
MKPEPSKRVLARDKLRLPIPEMCNGCFRSNLNIDPGKYWCDTITEPIYFYEHYGECFAKMDFDTAYKVERAVAQYTFALITGNFGGAKT